MITSLQNGRFTFFLDGFDEVDDEHQDRVIEQVSTLARRYPESRIIASARPAAAIASSSWFTIISIAELTGSEYSVLLRHLTDNDTANRLISEVAESSIRHVLTTPLMVALLAVRFKIEQTVPENAHAFFDDLFDLLVRRHDLTKKGYRRNRKSDIGDYNMRRVFNGLCFLTRREGNASEFTLNKLHAVIASVCDKLGIRGEPDRIARDIISITNLILEEGGYCRFVHRSIQEFHAACFVNMIGGEFSKQFYEAAFIQGGWEQELRFLKQMDRHNFERILLLPTLNQWLRGNTGLRWFEAITGVHGEKLDYHDPRFERLNTLLDGYMTLSPRDIEEESPQRFAEKLRKLRDKVAQSVQKYKAISVDFQIGS